MTTSERFPGRRLAGIGIALVGACLFAFVFSYRLSDVPADNYQFRDDAVITLSHARNLVEFGFIGVSPSGERVQGFSAPLQFWIAAAIYRVVPFEYATFLGWQSVVGTLLLGTLVAVLLVAGATNFGVIRLGLVVLALAASAVVLASSRAFLLWHASGMENVYKCAALLGLLWALDRALREKRGLLFAAGLTFIASLTRADAVVPVAALVGTFVVLWWWRYRDVRGMLVILLGGSAWVVYKFVEYSYFGSWTPNTAAGQGIDVADRIQYALSAPGLALRDYAAWGLRVGGSLQASQLMLLPVVVWIARDRLARERALLVCAGSIACVAQFAFFGTARMDEARTVTELALYATLSVPFVLLASKTLETRQTLTACVLLPVLAVVFSLRAPDRTVVGWGTADFEVVSSEIFEWARIEGLHRPLVANPDLGALSWRKTFNVADLGRLGSVALARTPAPVEYILRVVLPDFVEMHDEWACHYGTIFSDADFASAYEPFVSIRTPWLDANCPEFPGARTGLWIRRDVRRSSLSAERRFIDEFGGDLSNERLRSELESCLSLSGERPCGYVGRTVFRFLPELRRLGHYQQVKAMFAGSSRLRLELAFISSWEDPEWWRVPVEASRRVG